MNDKGSRLPGDLLRKVSDRLLSRRIVDSVVIPALADVQHEYTLISNAPVWRRVFLLARGYIAFWTALALCLASCPATSLRKDWLASDALGPRLLGALAPRAGMVGFVLTFLLVGRQWGRHGTSGDAYELLLLLPGVISLTVPIAFLLALGLALSRLGDARSTPTAPTRWLGPTVGLSIAFGLFTLVLCGWVTPRANQSYVFRLVRAAGMPPIAKGRRELTLGELQARIRDGRKAGESTAQLDVEWHKKWAIPAECLLFGPFAIGLHGLWKRPQPAINLALALAVVSLLYVGLRLGEQMALGGQLGPVPAIWAGDAFLALVTLWLIARLRRSATARRS